MTKRRRGTRAVRTEIDIVSSPALGRERTIAALRDEGLRVEDGPGDATPDAADDRDDVDDRESETVVVGLLDEPADLASRVLAALEQVVADGDAPLVPEASGPRSFVVRPPAA